MAISFPTSLDNFTNPSSGNTLDSPSHSLQHSDINDAVEALERKIGVGTAVAGSASAGQVLTISAAGTSTWSTPTLGGLVQLVPGSVAVGSGSGSVDTNGAVTFSGASSISLNDVFSSSYQNYRILMNLDSNSAGAFISMRLRVSGADNSTTSYAHTTYRNRMGSASFGAYTQTADGNTFFRILTEAQTETTTGSYDVFNPFISEYTQVSGIGTNNLDTFGFSGSFNATTSFTGFTFLPNTGTITGTIRVYGYKN